MNIKLTLGERLKDLRVERHLSDGAVDVLRNGKWDKSASTIPS